MGGQVDDNNGLLASGRGTDGRRTEDGRECVGRGLDGRLEPGNIVDLDSGGRGDEGKGPFSIGLSSPGKQLGQSAHVR